MFVLTVHISLSTGVLPTTEQRTNINPTTPDSTSDQEDNIRSDYIDIHTSANYQATDSDQESSISVQGNNPPNDPQTSKRKANTRVKTQDQL